MGGESVSTFLIVAISGLSGVVSSLAIYIWRGEVERRKAAEAKLAEYERPAREATAELLRLAGEKRRQRGDTTPIEDDDDGSGDDLPWPWTSSSEQTRRSVLRKPRKPG